MLIGIPSHWRFAPLLMGSLQTVSNHLARTSTGHLAKCIDCPDPPDACKCWNGSALVDKPDYEITISGVTNPSSSYLTCTGCTSFFNRTVTLSCGDSYDNPGATGLYLICGPSSSVPTCGLLTNETFGVLGRIDVDYAGTYIQVDLTCIVGYTSGLGYNTVGGSEQTFRARIDFDDRTCNGNTYTGQLCTVTRATDLATTSPGLCTETDDMVCGVASASVSFTAV